MKKLIHNTYLRYGLFLISGILLGWLLFHSPHRQVNSHGQKADSTTESVWTCAMHPHIRMNVPGKCPICGMDLIPLTKNDAVSDPAAIHFSREALHLANVMTSVVTRQQPVKEVRLYGKIQMDERQIQTQAAQISGRVEKLLVNYTGEQVHKGDILALMYSPELITAQKELLEAAKMKDTHPEIYEAVKEKLRGWKIAESLIASIESSGSVTNDFAVVSNTTGIIFSRRVNNGDYVSQGTVLYEVADLSRVWAMFDAYESDLLHLHQGDRIEFMVGALPGEKFSGVIAFIDPVMDPVTRVAKVRVETDNHTGRLKPEMFVTGIVRARLNEYRNSLVIPRSAVLWTGTRSVVYVKKPGTEEPFFIMREIGLGPMLGSSYVVTDGLDEGEEIVTRGAFSVDAAAQLEGKPSMMNSTEAGNTMIISFGVSGSCEMCRDRIENAARSVKGVTDASWDIQSKKIRVIISDQNIQVHRIHKAIALAGHDTEIIRADEAAYNALPECCLYRSGSNP